MDFDKTILIDLVTMQMPFGNKKADYFSGYRNII
jgi:uncharacterized protein (DUF3820 family)